MNTGSVAQGVRTTLSKHIPLWVVFMGKCFEPWRRERERRGRERREEDQTDTERQLHHHPVTPAPRLHL